MDFEPIKKFVDKILVNLSTIGYLKAEDKEYNEFIYEVLLLCKVIMEFGFYQS